MIFYNLSNAKSIPKFEMTIFVIHHCKPKETTLDPIQRPKMCEELEVPQIIGAHTLLE